MIVTAAAVTASTATGTKTDTTILTAATTTATGAAATTTTTIHLNYHWVLFTKMSNKKSSNKVYCLDDTNSDKDKDDLDVVAMATTGATTVIATTAVITAALTTTTMTEAMTTAVNNRNVNLNDVLCGRGMDSHFGNKRYQTDK